MQYPIVIHKDPKSDYGVTVPDLPGCFSAGSTLDEAMAMAREAIELHLEGLMEEGLPVPDPKPVERHRSNRDYAGGIWALVAVNPLENRGPATRVNVTLPRRVLKSIDRFAARHRQSRSGLLARAATAYIATAEEKPRIDERSHRRKTAVTRKG